MIFGTLACLFNTIDCICRGDTFQAAMLRIGELCSILPKHVHAMALTATATKDLRIEVARIIGMQDELVVSVSPCKAIANIMYAIG